MESGERLITNIVSDGLVDYDGLTKHADDLNAALAAVAGARREGMSQDDEYAFLLNAYNICALDAARRRLHAGKRKGSLKNPVTWLRFFLATPVTVAGQRMSLYTLEMRHIRPHLRRDPRGHFALVCAAAGCPPLRHGLYHGDTLDDELAAAGRAFIAGCNLDRERGVLELNRIFKWYRKDFRATGGPLQAYLHHATPDDAAWVKEHRPHIRYLPYDWDLNIRKRSG